MVTHPTNLQFQALVRFCISKVLLDHLICLLVDFWLCMCLQLLDLVQPPCSFHSLPVFAVSLTKLLCFVFANS